MSIKRSGRGLAVGTGWLIAAGVLAALLVVAFMMFRRYLVRPALTLKAGETFTLLIPTGGDFATVTDTLAANGVLADAEAFETASTLTGYRQKVHAGRYVLRADMTFKTLLEKLGAGSQDPARVTFTNVRTLETLAGVVAKYIEPDSATLLAAMRDIRLVEQLHLTEPTLLSLYLPDTYEVWWNVSAEAFIGRMVKEYKLYWTDERQRQAAELDLTPPQVATLASIINEETNKSDEYDKIASLYLNRLRIGMALQACPTLRYALGDYTIQRLGAEDMQVESPYNTYKYPGLPPGPIRIASKKAMEAVLAPAKTEYLYMCAKPDGSGYHDFARTLEQHQRNAAAYHRQLNKLNIHR